MRVVGLVSGGKDSSYNLLQCVAAGHQIVALANLSPPRDEDEIDSFMYQSVGHSGIELYADALGLPLFRRYIEGTSISIASIDYTPTDGDEVEDLYVLLQKVKDSCDIDAVSVGAVLSDYQRVRVENVCSRLGLVCLSYLWQRNQSELLNEMIGCGVHSIIIKVAAVGLQPSKHLGKSIAEMSSYLHKMKEKYNLNVCGEGGEYETFTLDCPLFKKRIVIDEIEVKELTGDVGYINFKSLLLHDKEIDPELTQFDLIKSAGIPSPNDYLKDLTLGAEEQQFEDQAKENTFDSDISEHNKSLSDIFQNSFDANIDDSYQMNTSDCTNVISNSDVPSSLPISIVTAPSGYSWVTHIKSNSATEAINTLRKYLEKDEVYLRHVVTINMYVADMNDYAELNAEYVSYFSENPPTRACVQVPLEDGVRIQLDIVAWRECHVVQIENEDPDVPVYRPQRKTMHVQSISHWAPANIGPYSQGIKIGHVVHVAGMIALIPGTMKPIDGGIELQARLSLRHVSRVINVICPPADIRAVVQGVCFLTQLSDVAMARRMMARVSESQIVLYVVVPRLPRDALIEWHTWAHRENCSFHYEEKGCTRENFSIRLRRRTSHDSMFCAVIANASCSDMSHINPGMLKEFIEYSLSKLEVPNNDNICSMVTVYYVRDKVSKSMIVELLSLVNRFNINAAVSMVPVLAIEDKYTLLSLYATRH